MTARAKTYTVHFPTDARPGVQAIGGIKRGASTQVGAAEAVRLVDAKGLRFASAADEKAARAEASPPPPPDAPEPAAAAPAAADAAHDTLNEEH